MIEKHIIDFNESLIGLRDFVDLIDPFLNDKVEEHHKHIQPLVNSALIEDLLSEKDDWKDGEREEFLEMREKLNKMINTKYADSTQVIIEKDEVSEGELQSISISIKTSDDDVYNHIQSVKKTNKHISLLYTNSLISLLSNVEWFFSQILHFFYDKHPESAGVQKRTMTLADLKSFETIEDAEKHLIDIKIDEILRGNFESWTLILKDDIGLGLGYLKDMMDELVEIYQRRNLFVHNGGEVNSIYFSKVKLSLREGVNIKDKLTVDKDYLDNSICKLQKAFILVGAELWKKLSPEDEMRGDIIGDIIYENLLESRWDLCEGLCYFSLKDARINPLDKSIAQLNYWLCKKEQGRLSEVEKELNQTDFSDKKEFLQLGFHAIKGEHDKIVDILPILFETKQINAEGLEEFPILKEFRDTDAYKDFKETSKFFKEEN